MNANGNIPKDLALTSFSSSNITSKMITSIEHIDRNIIEIERDIFELQDVALQTADETTNIMHEITTVQNDLVDLQYIQTLPWFCKSNFSYGDVKTEQWDNSVVPDSGNQMFVRTVQMDDTFTGMFLFLPKSAHAGEARSVSVSPRTGEAAVFVSTNPRDAVRLTSLDLEWVPSVSGDQLDTYVGHKTLLSKPGKLNGFLFGSVLSYENEDPNNDQCVVFPEAGACYIQTIYLDNNNGNSKLVFVFQKFKPSVAKALCGFSFCGVH